MSDAAVPVTMSDRTHSGKRQPLDFGPSLGMAPQNVNALGLHDFHQGLQQHIVVERLAEVTRRSHRKTLLANIGLVMRGNNDRGNAELRGIDLTQYVDAHLSGHVQVQHEAIVVAGNQRLQEIRSAGKFMRLVPGGTEQAHECLANRCFVIDDGDSGCSNEGHIDLYKMAMDCGIGLKSNPVSYL